ncbi:uncharacterized protein [Populus alba]|uniref:uncharacterized protein n=1 Tax=Populus alba TaxID=43335 RepID=UPI00158B9CDD|nr:uncharacterized protein LOC118054792 isoform X1 [Populus alba]
MATANSSQSISMPLPIFYGSDYDLWEKKMMTLFKSQNLTGIVKKGPNKPTNISILEEAQQKELEVKDASALYLIQQSLAITIFPRISEASTAKQAWDKLKEEFGGDSKIASEIEMEAPYRAAMKGEWQRMIDYYQEHFGKIHCPVTPSYDTVLHLAVISKTEQPLKALLEIMKGRSLPEAFLKRKNKFGNTALHEATIYGNYEAVMLLVESCADLLKETNKYGETPLFTAAGFAETGIVEFIIRSKPEQCVDDNGRLLTIHIKRSEDDQSILSAAIIGRKFETALLLLELDKSLASLKDRNQISTLQLLAEMPTAFESGSPMGICERLIYYCLPVPSPCEVKSKVESFCQTRNTVGDLESGQGRNSGDLGSSSERNQRGGLLNYLKILEGCWLERIWNQKRKHVFALTFAANLIEKDESLKRVTITDEDQNKEEEDEEMRGKKNKKEEKTSAKDTERPQTSLSILSSLTTKKQIPLFTATRRGIEEIVVLIIALHPYAIDQRDEMDRTILDVAVMYRQKKIFDIVKEQKIPMARMRRFVDNSGNTLLHHVADMKKNSGVTKPGPALQLQEELKWFERVQEVIPSYYVPLLNKDGMTARECFEIAHEKQLEKAQIWIKETSQSCSTVAALVATVVFAAAYTVPGGSDETGKPIFINSPYFLIFTVSDVVSLASSLTSLVVFLSLLTSPFELQEFHISLPRKLIVGFSFLFFSVLTTMLSFGATILILIQTERRLTTLLLSIASFLPVLIFGILQFRLYVTFMGTTLNIVKPEKLIQRFLSLAQHGGK